MLKRKVAVIDGAGQVTTREEEVPELKHNQVLIKVYASLVSPGTEVGGIKNSRVNPKPEQKNRPFGYANAGEVVRVAGDAKGIKPGMRVAAMGGSYALHASYACAPLNLVVPIPDSVSFAEAAYAHLGATSLQSVRRAEPQIGEYGLVLGLGIVGNIAAQLFQLSGARIIAWEALAKRKGNRTKT